MKVIKLSFNGQINSVIVFHYFPGAFALPVWHSVSPRTLRMPPSMPWAPNVPVPWPLVDPPRRQRAVWPVTMTFARRASTASQQLSATTSPTESGVPGEISSSVCWLLIMPMVWASRGPPREPMLYPMPRWWSSNCSAMWKASCATRTSLPCCPPGVNCWPMT